MQKTNDILDQPTIYSGTTSSRSITKGDTMNETYQELMKYSVKRFNSAYNNHLIKDELVREIETTLNTLTEKIYNINNQRVDETLAMEGK
tara:strand:+ start:577 stop:846 length:270 start_codon:yes stop_codon:yes gene_type:complete